MPNTAAFLVTGQGMFGACLVMRSGDSAGGSGPVPGAMRGPLVIDENGRGTLNEMDVRQLGGRVAGQAARVVIELADGSSVTASVGGGYWLAWWPDTAPGERVVATDAAGAKVAELEVTQ